MKSEFITVRQELHWHLISRYLHMLSQIGIARKDEVFYKMFKDIQSYVDKKLTVGDDIIETFVTVVYQPEK